MIANYVFDSVPVDAFAVDGGVLEECLVEVSDALELTYSRRPAAPGHYGDEDLDALLEHYRGNLGDTVVTIPRTALECLRRLRALSGDRLLVLAADKALSTEEALGYREEPQPTRHAGAFSLMVNFHALRGTRAATAARRCTAGTASRRSTSARSSSAATTPRRERPTTTRSSASAPATSHS